MTFYPTDAVVRTTTLELEDGGDTVIFELQAVSPAAAVRLFEAIKSDLESGLVLFGEIGINAPLSIEEGAQ